MTAPERIWAMRYYGKSDEGFWDTSPSPHTKEDAQHEYILHTREALAGSEIVRLDRVMRKICGGSYRKHLSRHLRGSA